MANPVATLRRANAAGGRVFYGWWIVGSGFLVNTFNGALVFHAFGAYVVLLEEDFGWSRTTFAIAFALQRIESGLLGPIEGWAIDRFGPRRVMMTGLVLFALGFLAFSQIDSVLTFYLAFMLIAIGSVLGSFLPATVAVVNWFSKRRALALALVSMGFAAGGLIQPGVVALLEGLGWRNMAIASGLFVLVIGLPLAALMRHRPEDHGMRPDGAAAREDEPPPERGFTARQALRTRAFWCIALGHSSSLLVIGAVMVHFVAHVNESLGYSLGFAASMITVMTVAMMFGQTFIGGFLGDRLHKRAAIVVALFGHTVALLLLAYAGSAWMVFAFVLINGLAMGSRGPLIQAMRADYFGRESYRERAPHVELQQHVASARERRAQPGSRRAVAVAVHLGVLDQLAGGDRRLEALRRGEEVVDAVGLARAREARGHRERADEAAAFEQERQQRVLAHARGPAHHRQQRRRVGDHAAHGGRAVRGTSCR